MSARNAKAKRALPVVPATPGKSHINATRTADTVTLELPSDFSIVVKNGARREPRNGTEIVTILCTPGANGEVEGWSVEKRGVTAMDDTTVYVRATQPPRKPYPKKHERRGNEHSTIPR